MKLCLGSRSQLGHLNVEIHKGVEVEDPRCVRAHCILRRVGH
jgi:hypothetical protein